MEEYTHESMPKYWAVDRALGLWDGPVHFRYFSGPYNDGTSSTGFFNHNYFMYESSDRREDKFRLVACVRSSTDICLLGLDLIID